MKFYLSKLLVLSLLGFFSCSNAAVTRINQEKPKWVKQRPNSKTHYIGIAVEQKDENNRDYIKTAQQNALNDLASQILVNIKSETFSQVVEKSGIIEDEFKSFIKTSTKNDLEGYELVDTWENKKEYWIYYRLSKAVYEKLKREKINKAISLSLDMFSNGRSNEKFNNIEKALLFYFQALNPIEKYINEPLETNFEGSQIYLMNEIYSSLQNILSNIELKTIRNNLNAKIGQPIRQPLQVSAVYLSSGSENKVGNLPLKFSFVRGSGDLIEKVRTDRNGIGKTNVSKITATDKLQIVKAETNINSFINQDSTSFIISSIASSLTIPSTTIILNVSGLSAFIDATENHFGQKLEIQHLEPALKKDLSERGFTFIDNPGNADVMFKISAESRRGAEVYGMCSSFVNINISVINLKTGDEIYKSSLHDIKGIDLNYSKAGLKAFENAAKEVQNILVPELLRTIQR